MLNKAKVCFKAMFKVKKSNKTKQVFFRIKVLFFQFNRVIFDSENDFASCIKQSFPHLKTNKLRRKQWRILRSLIGKPRRYLFTEKNHFFMCDLFIKA